MVLLIMSKICIIETCDRGKPITRGYCARHYQKLLKYGDPLAGRDRSHFTPDICTIDDCEKKYLAKGYCDKHYQKYQKYGDPLFVRPVRQLDDNGYRRLYIADHPNAKGNGEILEHRFIMSEHLDRPLKETESVHHRNGIRHDNRLENLELRDRYHGQGQTIPDLIEWAVKFLGEHGYEVYKK